MTSLDANRRLAELLGWADIFDVGGALLGTPPGGSPHSRDQAKVPDWTGDWQDCGPLICAYGLLVEKMQYGVRAGGIYRDPKGFSSDDAALRATIVADVITKLEVRQ